MRIILLFTLLSFACNAQSATPKVLSNYDYTEQKILTEDGEEFIACIAEDKEALRLNKVIRKLDLIE